MMLGDSLRRRQPARRQRPARPRARGGRTLGLRFWIPAVLLALAIPFGIGYVWAAYLMFPEPEVEVGTGIPVPALRGLDPVAAERALAQAGLGRLVIRQLPSDAVPEGQIMAQSPLPGQQLRSGADVRAALSTGAPRARVPDVLGLTADQAEQALRRAGLDVVRTLGDSPIEAGRVYALEPAPGSELRLPAAVTLRVSLGPPVVDSLVLPDPLLPVLPDSLPLGR